MATQKTPIKDEDPLGKLIVASNNAPLPWGQQQKMVELFMKYIEEQGLIYRDRIEKLEHVIETYKKATKMVKEC